MRFNVITTYDIADQDIIDIDLSKDHYEDEEKFIKIILDCIDVSNVAELNKISVLQYTKKHSEVIKWLLKRNGKYYFNYDVNDDDDTKRWYEFKHNYLLKKKVIN